METRETAGSSCVKAEREERSNLKNDNGTSDSEEVSPSATDDGSGTPWSAFKCVFCNKTTVNFEDVKLLECLHSACMDCVNTQSNSVTVTSENRGEFLFQCFDVACPSDICFSTIS